MSDMTKQKLFAAISAGLVVIGIAAIWILYIYPFAPSYGIRSVVDIKSFAELEGWRHKLIIYSVISSIVEFLICVGFVVAFINVRDSFDHLVSWLVGILSPLAAAIILTLIFSSLNNSFYRMLIFYGRLVISVVPIMVGAWLWMRITFENDS